MECDRKFRNFWGSTKAVRRLSDTICIENGLPIVENPKPHGKNYNKWLGNQAKLQAGKGAGYARWAKVFNLKQMAQTVNYLTEHNLLEYAVLRTHIINYAKPREVYVEYRKAGYSKKFREEHEAEVLLHQAAKANVDRLLNMEEEHDAEKENDHSQR